MSKRKDNIGEDCEQRAISNVKNETNTNNLFKIRNARLLHKQKRVKPKPKRKTSQQKQKQNSNKNINNNEKK